MDAYYTDSGCGLSGNSYELSPISKSASYFSSGDYCLGDETHSVGIFSNTVHQSFSGDTLCNTVSCGPSVCSSAGLWRSTKPDRRLSDSQKQSLSKPASLFGVCSQSVSSASTSYINTNAFTAPGFGFDEIMDTLCDPFTGSAADADIFSNGSGCRQQQLLEKPKKTLVSLATTNSYITNDHGFITPQVGVGIGGTIGDSSLVDLLRTNDDDNDMIVSSYAFHDASVGSNIYGNGNSAAKNLKQSSLLAGLHQQHMMGFSDIATADADDFDLEFIVSSCKMASLPNNNLPKYSSLTAAAVASQTNSSDASTASGWPLHNGLLRMSNAPSLRVRNVPVTRIGSLLQHSIQNATHVHGPGHKVRNHSGSCTSLVAAGPSGVGQRVGRIRSSTSSSRLTDVRGGRPGPPNQTYLDDHRYTMKMFPTGPPQSRRHPSLPKSSSTSRLSGCGGNTSILEMFLRSSRQMDPNKGSNAALAAEGLGNLHLGHCSLADNVEDEDEVDDERSGTLLMQLLTGKMDQNDVHRERQREISDRSNRNVIAPICQQQAPSVAAVQQLISTHCVSGDDHDEDSTLKTVTSVDSLLVDDLGFLNDQQSIGLLEDFDAADALWMTASIDVLDDMSISDDLDEILREQNRQDFLLLQHYATEHQP